MSRRVAAGAAPLLWVLCALAPPAAAQAGSGSLALTTRNLVFATRDLVFNVVSMGGKVQDLQIKQTELEIKIDLAADVLFDFDKDTLKPGAQETLQKAAAVIREQTKGQIRIEGHTDAKGDDAYNQRLSERRAASVKNWFVKNGGLGGRSFSTQGFGEKNPVAANAKPDGSDDPEGRQKNRRVEITIKK